jgi:hypothetical protein
VRVADALLARVPAEVLLAREAAAPPAALLRPFFVAMTCFSNHLVTLLRAGMVSLRLGEEFLPAVKAGFEKKLA